MDLTITIPAGEWRRARELASIVEDDERSVLGSLRLRSNGSTRRWYAANDSSAVFFDGDPDAGLYDVGVPPSILRFDVGRGTLLSMVGQGFGITIVGAAASLLPITGIVFLPFADEPEPVPFSAVWSPCNRNATLRNMLALAGKMNRRGDSFRLAWQQ